MKFRITAAKEGRKSAKLTSTTIPPEWSDLQSQPYASSKCNDTWCEPRKCPICFELYRPRDIMRPESKSDPSWQDLKIAAQIVHTRHSSITSLETVSSAHHIASMVTSTTPRRMSAFVEDFTLSDMPVLSTCLSEATVTKEETRERQAAHVQRRRRRSAISVGSDVGLNGSPPLDKLSRSRAGSKPEEFWHLNGERLNF